MKNRFHWIRYLPWICLLSAICIVSSCKNAVDHDYHTMEVGFKRPPDSVKLSIYWYWINGNISHEGVTKDLESMAKAGIGRAYIGNIGLKTIHGNPAGRVKLFSNKWWAILKHTFIVADSLGIQIGMFNSPGWSQSGGPWVKPKDAMRYITHTAFDVNGPGVLHKKLQVPDSNFQRTAVLAFPVLEDAGVKMENLSPRIEVTPQCKNASFLIDNDISTQCVFPKPSPKDTTRIVHLYLNKEMTVRSLLLYPAKIPFKAKVRFQVKEGMDYRTIKDFEFDRTNSDIKVGFMPYGPVAVSFPVVKGIEFRLIFSSLSATGGLSEIELMSRSYLERFVEKQLGKMFQTPHPMWDAYRWKDQGTSYSGSLLLQSDSVRNITSCVSANGILDWNIPEGKWTIMQMGMLPTGVTNHPATPEATGLEIDKMNIEDLSNHFDAFIGEVLSRISAKDRKAFKYVVADSYETGPQNWTDGFTMDFEKRYGYSPLPWLPVLSGYVIGSTDQSDRFLWDMRRLIADRVAYQYVGGLRELSHQHGLKLWLENYGHWGFPAEFLQYGGQSDEIGGEFWVEGSLGDIELKAASSAAHIYGKNKVYAESFTAGGKAFQRYPGYLKKRGDWAFTQGVNSTLLHVYIAQPSDSLNPGINAGFGTEFNRNNTWFEMGQPYFDYLRRCNYMLQQGHPVEDVAYYIGENAPVMTGIQKPKLPKGYSYDWINAEVIENRLTVKDDNLVLPDGISYKLLVLPPEKTMRPPVLKKIMDLVKDGATILGPRPERSPSLQNFPEADDQVKKMAEELWQNCDGKKVKMVRYGRGRVLSGMSMEDAFEFLKATPDFKVQPGVPVLYTHRKTDDADIYFISNQSDSTIQIDPSFRVRGKQPEWWDAIDGSTKDLSRFTQEGHATTIPITLQAAQSSFVVFRKSTSEKKGEGTNFPDRKTVSQIQGPWKVRFDTAMRGPVHDVTFSELEDWKNNSNDSIRYYSGTAVYETPFEVSEKLKNAAYYLDLGKVGVMAKVNLNGKKIGSVWTTPLEVNITDALKEGRNQLKIKVVNTWVNRLIGDSKLPESERKTHVDVNPYHADSPLQASGLIGPVTLKETVY